VAGQPPSAGHVSWPIPRFVSRHVSGAHQPKRQFPTLLPETGFQNEDFQSDIVVVAARLVSVGLSSNISNSNARNVRRARTVMDVHGTKASRDHPMSGLLNSKWYKVKMDAASDSHGALHLHPLKNVAVTTGDQCWATGRAKVGPAGIRSVFPDRVRISTRTSEGQKNLNVSP
jgi:hypothetical protein